MSKEDLIQEIVENMARCQRPASFSTWQKTGLSHAQTGLLFMLSYHQRLQVKQIALFLGVSKSAVSQLAEPLLAKKLIERETDSADRRIVFLSLSHKGKQTLKKLAQHKYAGFRSRLEKLPARDLEQLAQISRQLSVTQINN